MDSQGASHVFGSQSAAVESKAVTVFPGGEAVTKYSSEILGEDADSVINYGYADAIRIML